ncbi:hypothetical protein LWI28_004674 [Acer negundo]|uniref:Transmembrane protein n=1 Tax=Acer negundo TaxID=4023 RepID=A0AAD5IHP7_ACENE|nr:hypothetical protein LWI28_004674 [Acer negundo]
MNMLGASSTHQGKYSNYFESLPLSTNECVPSIVQVQKVELKPLPETLRYAYMRKEETLPKRFSGGSRRREGSSFDERGAAIARGAAMAKGATTVVGTEEGEGDSFDERGAATERGAADSAIVAATTRDATNELRFLQLCSDAAFGPGFWCPILPVWLLLCLLCFERLCGALDLGWIVFAEGSRFFWLVGLLLPCVVVCSFVVSIKCSC